MNSSELKSLSEVLTGKKKPTQEENINLLRVAVMCAVAGLYEHYKDDVVSKFSIEELRDIVDTTQPFQDFTVEHIFHTALYGE